MLWLVCVFNYADRQSIYSIFPKLKEEFGLDDLELGAIGSAFMWLYAFGSPIAGWVGDRVARKPLILGGCLFWSVVTCLTGVCTHYWQFVTVRALEGGGETFYFPAALSLMSDYHGPKTRSRALALHQSGVYVGTILGSVLGAWFAVHYSWRVGFYFFGGTGALLALILFRFLRDPARGAADRTVAPLDSPEEAPAPTLPPASVPEGRPPTVAATLRLIFAKPTGWMLMLVFLGANFVATIFLSWMPTFLLVKFHYSLVQAGLIATLYIQLASAVGSPLGGWLADRWVRRAAGGRMRVQALGLLAGAACVSLVAHASEERWLILAMIAFGLCKGLYDSNIWASLYDVIEPRSRATATGIMNTVGWSGGALGPLFVGFMMKYGHEATASANMSQAIGIGAAVYVTMGAVLLFLSTARAHRDLLPTTA
jgi:MFS family permease